MSEPLPEPSPSPHPPGAADVVVSGVGVVGCFGLGVEPLAVALAAGEACTRPIEHLPGLAARRGPAERRVGVAARVAEDVSGPWIGAREARRMSPPSRFAVVASRMALAGAAPTATPAAGAAQAAVDPGLAVVLATAYGASSFTQLLLDQEIDQSPEAMSPYYFMESVANAPAGQVAIHCRAGGHNETLCQREAGPVSALGRGAALLAAGRAERVLVGAVEELTPLLFSVLDRFGALAAEARPFDRRRRGVLAAEGATVLLLERGDAARARGARGLARIAAWGGAFDATAPRNDWGRGGAALASALRRGLRRAGLGPEQVSAVVSGASGAVRGDRLEAEVLRALFADRALPPVVAPKAVTGEYGGALLAAALLAVGGREIGSPAGFEPDPELGIDPWRGGVLPDRRRLLLTTLAAGGSAAWVILEPPDPEHATR